MNACYQYAISILVLQKLHEWNQRNVIPWSDGSAGLGRNNLCTGFLEARVKACIKERVYGLVEVQWPKEDMG